MADLLAGLVKAGHFQGGQNLYLGGRDNSKKILSGLLRELQELANVAVLDSDAGAGGGASEAMTVTGLLATDEVLSVSQSVAGGNDLAMTAYNTQVEDGLTVEWTADPGAGAVVKVLVRRALS